MGILAPRYYEKHHVPKWNGPATPLQVPRLMRHWMSKEEHSRQAKKYITCAKIQKGIYKRILRHALEKYGDGNGVLIAGVYRDHFPAHVKDQLRKLESEQTDFTAAAFAHWQAAGRRVHTLRRKIEEENAK